MFSLMKRVHREEVMRSRAQRLIYEMTVDEVQEDNRSEKR